MKCHAKWRLPLWAGALTFVAFGLVAAQAKEPKPAPKKNNRVHVVQWAKDAKLSRKLTAAEIEKIKKARKKDDKKPIPTYKAVAGVKANTNLEVPDVLETKKQGVVLTGGTLFHQRYGPNTKVTFLRINPTEFDFAKPIDFQLSIEKGKGQFRAGTLAQPSSIKTGGQMVTTAPKGTAYSINVQGQKTTLIVAEGKVDIYLESAPGAAVTVNPREKFVYTVGQPFPEQATPIAAADEREIRDLLSLPVQNLYGYESGRDIRRADAEDIVVTHVEYIDRVVDTGSLATYKPSWKSPNRVYLTGRDNFWTTDANGGRANVGKGFYLEGLSPDGKIIYASKPNQGLWRMDWNGANKVQITKRPVGGVTSIAPNGLRLVAREGWHQVPIKKWDRKQAKYLATGKKEWAPSGKWIVLDVPSRAIAVLNTGTEKINGARAFWKQGGKRLIVGLGLSKGSKFVDADKSPARELLRVNSYVGYWWISPASKWLYGPEDLPNNPGMKFVRLSDGRVFTHPEATPSDMSILLGEKAIKLGDKVVEIDAPDAPGRDVTPEDQTYSGVFPSQLDVSPNGEILAYKGEETPYLASFADSLDLNRFSTTAVATSHEASTDWLSGNRILYKTYDGSRTRNQILTLGVKKKSDSSTLNQTPDTSELPAPRLPVLDLLGASHVEVLAKLGVPTERNDFNSWYVLHLHYQIPGLGTVKLMFQAVDPDYQETWLQRVEIQGLENFGDQEWASKLGLNLSDGWKKGAGGDTIQAGFNYPDSKDRRYAKTTQDGAISVEFGHDPQNKQWPNMAQLIADGPKRSNRPVTRRETNRLTKLLRMRKADIDKELGKPISTKGNQSSETCVYNYPGTMGLTITYYGQGTGTPNDIPGMMHVSFAKGTTWQIAAKTLEITGSKLGVKPWASVKGAFEIIGHRYWPHSFIFTPDNARYPDGELVDQRGLPQISID